MKAERVGDSTLTITGVCEVQEVCGRRKGLAERGLNHKELCAHPMRSLDFILQSQGASETRLPPLSIYCGPDAVLNHCDTPSLVRDNQS